MRGNLPPMPSLIQGRLYKVRARAAERMADDYSYSLWDGTTGFVGLRTKFNSRYIDTELHYDASDSFGTVSEAYDTGIDCPLVAGWTAEQWVEAWGCVPLFDWLDEHAIKLGGMGRQAR